MLQQTLRRATSAAVALTFVMSSSAFAASSDTYTVTPDTLRTALYTGNTDVFTGLNTLYHAKEQLTQARTNLLPSLNLAGVLNGASAFSVLSVNVLLPFLLPSNWHALDATRKQLTANGYAYQLVLLNDYASILSMYATIQGDKALRDVYVQERDNLRSIAQTVADEVAVGTAFQTDLQQAEAQVQDAEYSINTMDELIARELSSLRQAMGMNLKKNLVITPYHFPELDAESETTSQIFERVRYNAPEVLQIDSLIAASKDTKYASEWSFLNNASLSTSLDSKSGSFSKLSGGAGVNLGFGLLPLVHLSSLDIAAMQIRKREVALEQQQVIESALGSVNAAKSAVANARLARDNYQKALQAELDKVRLGTATLIDAFTVSNFATTAGINYANAVADLDNQRIALNRVLIANQFAKIPTCHLNGKLPHGGIGGFFHAIFGGKKKRYISVDELCRPSGEAESYANGSHGD